MNRETPPAYLPTLEQIAQATAEIRSQWSEEEYYQRSTSIPSASNRASYGMERQPYTVPLIILPPEVLDRLAS